MANTLIAQPQTFAKARKDTLRVELVETGEISAVNSTVVAAPPIWSLDLQIIDMAPEGIQVDSGAVIVQFDRAALLTRLAASQTELDGHRADLRRMQTEQQARIGQLERGVEMAEYALKLAQVQLEQLKYESATRQENGKLEVLKAEIALKEAKTKLQAQTIINDAEAKKQQLRILQSQGQVNDLKRQLDQLTLRAPISGMVVYHPDWDGSKPAIGDKVRPGRGIIDLPDLSRMQVKINVNEIDAARLVPNQPALIRLDAFPAKLFHGHLTATTKIAAMKEQGSQVRIFESIVEITESDSLLKPGMTAQVRLQLEALPDVTVIPIGCVYELDGQPVVFTRKSPKKPVPIKLGARNDFYVSVEGLEAGTEVSWQAGVAEAQPLGYAEFQKRLRRPPAEYQNFFTEMEKRHLTFDYEAYRHRPPEPPGGAPGGTEAMLKKFGFPSGELADKGGKIVMTPEMQKGLQKMPDGNIMRDSAGTLKRMLVDTLSVGTQRQVMIFRGNPEVGKPDSTKKPVTKIQQQK
ncbi:MAG: efflux RND transporter periplasmic adaptor subunit [candidate division KSB1 bacterium]|nr:efflux RND transporter periplasmic adaptor subunit [candidate division KSB1 bacterium]MDZ7310013.1 efflux RND transporter periplasmic adaptor subunit [candidate division KSB1 bacterium]